MKNILNWVGTFIVIGLVMWVAYLAKTYRITKYKQEAIKEYKATLPQYKESEVNKLKRELDDQRLKSLKLQAALDSCKYNITAVQEVTTSKVVFKRKAGKALSVCNEELMSTKAQLGQCISAKAQMEVEKDLQINKLNRQMDTCAYYIQEMDKALLKMSNDVTKLTNEKDSLTNVLQIPISLSKEFPCLKAKKGTVVTVNVIPSTGAKDAIISNFNLPKDKYKAAKKSCKKAQAH